MNTESQVPLGQVLAQFRDDARNNRDLGDRFERMMQQFFRVDPLYAALFSEVWMWNDWPKKGQVGDVGIDLVAQHRATGEYFAIQCKFYLPEHTLSKGDIDSFFTALGKPQFSQGIIVSTTDNWGKNALDALNQTKSVARIGISDLEQSPIDWSGFDTRKPGRLKRTRKNKIRPHQQVALNDVIAGLAEAERGKLIMACGTGKTFTALKIAETLAPKLAGTGKKGGKPGHVLFLVPSLSLMAQTLREWTAHTELPLQSLAVCSDASIGKRREKNGDDSPEITLYDLPYPATTNDKQLLVQYTALVQAAQKSDSPPGLVVVFSTYQSIEAVSKAQKAGLPGFDLIICDEAHRTTGVTLTGEDESAFVKVHDAKFLKGTKRLYMTATPRIYGDDAKSKAKEVSAEIASMDNVEQFGNELHRLGFGEAVGKSLLSDYKVLVLAVDERYVSKTFQKQIASKDNELNLEDATKITGCWNGLEKRFEATKTDVDLQGDVNPMRRAVAFSRSIKDSKKFVEQFGQIVAAYKSDHPDSQILEIEADHVDGTFDALKRGALLDWLKAESPASTCRILSNARCLSEGVDVPALDAVLFLNPRNSVIDVVQSVGRVMRRAEGKRYGYIILPIGIPADKTPEEALKDNEKYKVVWQVLQALRAHDDRFNATINQLELNKKRPENIQVIGVGGGPEDNDQKNGDGDSQPKLKEVQFTFAFPNLDEWKDAIYAKMVMKVGDRAYWETWARDIAKIAETHITRIKAILDDQNSTSAKAFERFLKGLRTNLNPTVSREDAIEMLAQHLITKPVFDALFANYVFTEKNPVSQSMQKMLDTLHEQALEKETATLQKFYASVRDRAKGLDNAEARQKVVIELYDEFFGTAFPRMAERLGIVYTPVEVVDFIIHSVQDLLRDEFKSGLAERDVHIIDPFTGTGTFLVRLLQSGLIPSDKLEHKYKHELHANEIVLLAYYIAAINIEEAYHGLRDEKGKDDYLPFEGICLTDTFQLYESGQMELEGTFPENNKRVKRQKESPIRVVIANPPYSAQQESENDDNKNLAYPQLDNRIRSTYAEKSAAPNVKNLYDSYIRAIRWASDRIKDKGVVGFVTNGSFIDANNMDGLRGCLMDEFTSVYVLNLRGNQRTSGELSRQEGGKIFGSGSRAPISIAFLVKNPAKHTSATLRYHDIGDYLDRNEKLKIIRSFASIAGIETAKKWTTLHPNEKNDWINQRDPVFEKFFPLGGKGDQTSTPYFENYSLGIGTNRDAWTYNYSDVQLRANMSRTIDFYNSQVESFAKEIDVPGGASATERLRLVEQFIDRDSKKISWSSSLIPNVGRQIKTSFAAQKITDSMYRPFSRQRFYYDGLMNHRVGQFPTIRPTPGHPNTVLICSGPGASKEFSALVTDTFPNLHTLDSCQCFPLYLYEKADESSDLFEKPEVIDGYCRRNAITDEILKTFCRAYGKDVTKEDIFYYVYGLLHSPEYRTRFAADLKKMLPRIPLTKATSDFKAFSTAGRKLAEWHLNYETVQPWKVEEIHDQLDLGLEDTYKVQKMTFARPTAEQKTAGAKWDKTRIIYNRHVTISKIPLEAYEYVVNGKSAIEWVMERYQFSREKDSGIVNDPNDWCKESKQPRYIIDLVARVVRVSVETMKIVNGLPSLNERRDGAPNAADSPRAAGDQPSKAVPFRPHIVEPKSGGRYVTCVPLVPLKAAAGAFSDPQRIEDDEFEWVMVESSHRLRKGMFVAQVIGKSMEPAIPDGAWCLFRAPVEGTRQGKSVLVQLRDTIDPETGQRYTVKRYESEKAAKGDSWRHERITLKPLNPDFDPIVLTGNVEGELHVIAELVEVLGGDS
jgi:predicted helicase/SOS-response transcriptional repressor LexA